MVRDANTQRVDPSWRFQRSSRHARAGVTAYDMVPFGMIPGWDGAQDGRSEPARRQTLDEKLKMTIVPEAPGRHDRRLMPRRFSIAAHIS